MDWTTAPSASVKGKKKKDPEKHIFFVQHVFPRFVWTAALTTKQPAEVLLTFKRIFETANITLLPDRLTTDAGCEFEHVKKCLKKRIEPTESNN